MLPLCQVAANQKFSLLHIPTPSGQGSVSFVGLSFSLPIVMSFLKDRHLKHKIRQANRFHGSVLVVMFVCIRSYGSVHLGLSVRAGLLCLCLCVFQIPQNLSQGPSPCVGKVPLHQEGLFSKGDFRWDFGLGGPCPPPQESELWGRGGPGVDPPPCGSTFWGWEEPG